MTEKTLDRLKRDPVSFIENFLGAPLWSKQKAIARSVVHHRKTSVRSSNGVGKTYSSARIALWWLFTRRYSTVITTAPTARQVNELLWKEIRKAYHGAVIPLGGTMLPKASKLTVDDDWLCIGFTADDDVGFQGWHSPGGVLAILDEAAGVPPKIWEAIEGCLVGENDRMLAIANPTDPSGPFFDLCKSNNPRANFKISAFDVPNVIEGRTVIPGLCTLDWVESRKREWGEDSPMYISRVLGEFPDADDRSLVPLSWVEQAFNRWDDVDWSHITQMGCDIARLGADSTILAPACDYGVKEMKRLPKQATHKTTGDIIAFDRELGGVQKRIDADGLGAGVYDMVKAQDEEGTIEMRGGMSASDPKKYFNARSEWYWNLRELLDPSRDSPIALPRSDNLQAQLTSIKWDMTPKGQIKIESKKEMLKRGVKSPDEADACMYAMAPVSSGGFFFV